MNLAPCAAETADLFSWICLPRKYTASAVGSTEASELVVCVREGSVESSRGFPHLLHLPQAPVPALSVVVIAVESRRRCGGEPHEELLQGEGEGKGKKGRHPPLPQAAAEKGCGMDRGHSLWQ